MLIHKKINHNTKYQFNIPKENIKPKFQTVEIYKKIK